MRRFALALLLTVAPGCAPCTWRPALVVSFTAIDGRRVLLTEERAAERWDVRVAATFVLVPRTPRRVLRPERDRRTPPRVAPPCVAPWLCAWERATRAATFARLSAAALETSP